MAHELTWEPRGVYVKFRGHVARAELFAVFEAITAHPRYDEIRYAIADHLEATRLDAQPTDMEHLSALDYAASLTNPRMLGAHVATDPAVLAQIHQFVAVNDAQHEHAVFTTLEEARRWIAGKLPPAPPAA